MGHSLFLMESPMELPVKELADVHVEDALRLWQERMRTGGNVQAAAMVVRAALQQCAEHQGRAPHLDPQYSNHLKTFRRVHSSIAVETDMAVSAILEYRGTTSGGQVPFF